MGRNGRLLGPLTVVLALFLVYGCRRPPVAATPRWTATVSPVATEYLMQTVSSTATATAEPSTPTQVMEPTIPATPDRLLDLENVAADVSYVLPLRVQHVSISSASLFFELEADRRGVLFYWPSDGDPWEANWVEFPEGSSRHQIVLNDLEPGVEYLAAVGLEKGDGIYRLPAFMGGAWDPVSFRTQSPDDRVWRVGIIGDSGFGETLTFELVQQMAGEDLDFVIHTGDIVYRVEQNRDPTNAFALKLFSPFAPILRRMPLYPVVGNHELDSATYWQGVPYYYWAFPGFSDPNFDAPNSQDRNEWYAFSYGEVQFLMLNTQVLLSGFRAEEQNSWLVGRLSDERFATSIAVFHVPPYTSGSHTLDGVDVRQFWQPLFEEAGVPLVLSGHDHNYERLILNGVTYIVSGGGSSVLYSLRSSQPGSQVFASTSHYVVMEIHPDRIEIRAVAFGREILDHTTISLGGE